MPGTEPAPLLLYLLKRVELAVRARLEEIVKPAGLTAIQYTALTVLERHDDMSSAQLARHSFVTAQSMADMITTLQRRGLIERHRDRTDRRRLVVSLTAEGRWLLDRYRDEVTALEGDMIAGLSGREIGELRAILNTCYDNLSPAARNPVRAPAAGEEPAAARSAVMERTGGTE
jgi:DNA-binding MarR family transcriptional regulator